MGNIVNRVFESAGPDGKVRGTPQQIIDKYQALARDAQVSGDRVAAENYLQHSEHYSRLLGEAQRQQGEQRTGQERDENRGDDQLEARGGNTQGGNTQGGNGQGGNTQGGGTAQGGAERREPREQQGGRPRSVPGFGLTTIETEDSDAEFGPIPTPESGEAQPRLSAPAAEYTPTDYKPAEVIGLDPRDAAPVAEQPAPAEARAPAVVEAPAQPAPEATEAAPAAEVPAEPAPEPKPKRPRTRRKAKADPAPEGAAEGETGKVETAKSGGREGDAEAGQGDAPAETQSAE